MWLKKLQIAVIEKNIDEINTLVSEMPKFKSIDEMKYASSLIQEALKLLHSLRDETQEALKKLKKHKDFLDTLPKEKNIQRLDITS